MRQDHKTDILFAAALGLAIYLSVQVVNVLLLVYVAALFAVVLAPAIGVVRRIRIAGWRPGRGVAMLIILLGLVTVVTIFFTLALPPIFHDLQAFAANLPQRLGDLSLRIQRVPFLHGFDMERLQRLGSEFAGGAFGIFKGVAGGIFGLFTWVILTGYFILDGERAFHWALSMFPLHQRERLERTLLRGEIRMRHWLVGQALLMLILGTSSMIVFAGMHLRYFYALAVLMGVANIIPIIGPIVSVTIASLVALADSPTKLLGVLAFYFVYQQFETAFLTPRIMKSTVDLPPLAVIIALILGGTLAGVVGALVAVPTAALCAVLIDEYLVKKDHKAQAQSVAQSEVLG